MNIMREAVVALGRVIGTVLGEDFDTPVAVVLEKYPTLPYTR